jgi:LPS-assembly lipoprotein
MWWRSSVSLVRLAHTARLAIVLAAAGLTAGCWQPLYGNGPAPGGEGVQDKFAAVEISPIAAPRGTPAERVAVGLRNALQFDLHNGAGKAFAPTYQLRASISTAQFTSYIDPNTGRPDSQIEWLTVGYQLVELSTGKTVVSDIAYAHVSFDIPGSQQRFAKQRSTRNAEDLAVEQAAQMMRNRLASYFVAGT